MSPTSSVLSLVSLIRKTATELKQQKELIGAKAVNGLNKLRKPFGLFVVYGKFISACGSVAQSVVVAATENETVASAVQTLVANVVQDGANRINEGANLLEQVGKDPVVQHELDEAFEAFSAYEKAVNDLVGEKKPTTTTAKTSRTKNRARSKRVN